MRVSSQEMQVSEEVTGTDASEVDPTNEEKWRAGNTHFVETIEGKIE